MKRKFMAMIMALALCAGLFAAMPLTASAAHNNTTVDISLLTADVASGTYTNWSYVAATNTITATGDVSVTGTKTGTTQTLNIDIAVGKTVTWGATYSGTTNTSGTGALVYLIGDGTFKMTGGSITQSGSSQTIYCNQLVVIEISGGTVTRSAASSSAAVFSTTSILINGGTVEATGASGRAVYGGGIDNITVSSGAVRATGTNGTAIYAQGSSNVIVSGGTVEATGTNAFAINQIDIGTITVNGGTILGNIVNPNSLTFNIAGTYTGAISGAGSLTKAGAGALVLSGNLSGHTGGIQTAAGNLVLNSDYTAVTGAALTVNAGATLTNNKVLTVNNTFTNNGTVTNNGLIIVGSSAALGGTTPLKTLTLDANGGTGTITVAEPESTIAPGNWFFDLSKLTTFLKNPTRGGYTLSGWDTAPTGGTGAISTGANHNFVPGSTIYAHWTAITPCEITAGALTTQYSDLDDALAAITDGTQTTITLLDDITIDGRSITGRNITFDLNDQYDLIFQSTSTHALTLNDSNVDYINKGAGSFQAIGLSGGRSGLNIDGGSCELTYAETNCDDCSAIYAQNGSFVTVNGDVTANGDGDAGVLAVGGSTVTVNGDVKVIGNSSDGIYAISDSTVTVTGDVVTTDATAVGAVVESGGKITIDGEISGTGDYVQIEGNVKTAAQFTTPTTKANYFTYTDGTSTVWVFDPTPRTPFTTYYTVTFVSNGGSAVASQSVASGGKAAKPADPTKDKYTFAGWYTDSGLTNAYDFAKPVTGNLTLYAKWAATPPVWVNPFTDVNAGDWFYGDVEYVYTGGLMLGTSGTLFSPNMSTTRAMLAAILYRAAGSPSVAGLSNQFSDIPAGTWYTNAVVWAVANGIVYGIGGGKYAPNADITRQDLAVILYRYANFMGLKLPVARAYTGFNDDKDRAAYAKDAIEALFKAGIINGKSGDKFDPTGQATRAEVAAMLHRLLEKEAAE